MNMQKETIKALKFLLKDECVNKWITYANNKRTIDLVCYMANLKLVNTNEYEQIKINKPNTRVYYNLEEISSPDLTELLDDFLKKLKIKTKLLFIQWLQL